MRYSRFYIKDHISLLLCFYTRDVYTIILYCVRLEDGFWYNFDNTLSINLIFYVMCMMQNSAYLTNFPCT